MAEPNPTTSHRKFRDAISRVLKEKREELLQRPPSVQRELQLKILEILRNAKARAAEKRSKKEGKARFVYSEFEVAPRWREIQGENSWKGLGVLDDDNPVYPALRAEIIRYGEFAQVTYDAFEQNRHDPNYGNCRYERSELFEKVDLNPGYEVRRYLYGTAQLDFPGYFDKALLEKPWSKHSSWIGYVAVTTSPEEIARLGRRDILIAWRGTARFYEWIKDLQLAAVPTGFPGDKDGVLVHKGFLNIYKSYNAACDYSKTSAREQVRSAVKQLLEEYKHEELSITITGHSLGSALATLCAYDLALEMNTGPDDRFNPNSESANGATGDARKIPITVYSFAGPRVGNRQFGEKLKELKVAVIRVANKHDIVTKVPHVSCHNGWLEKVKDKASLQILRFHHVGVKLDIDHHKSPHLETKNLLLTIQNQENFHNLEAYLHLVDGYHGPGSKFRETLLRPVALVNKRCNFLKTSYQVVPNWWQLRKEEGSFLEVWLGNGSGVRIDYDHDCHNENFKKKVEGLGEPTKGEPQTQDRSRIQHWGGGGTGGQWIDATPNDRQWIGATPNDGQWIGATPNDGQWIGATPNGGQWIGAVPNGGQWIGAAPNGGQWIGAAPNGRQWIGATPNGEQWIGATSNGGQWIGATPNGGQWIGATPNGGQWISATPNRGQWIDATPNKGHWIDATPTKGQWGLGANGGTWTATTPSRGHWELT